MLKSENLKLNLFEDSDYVRPEGFNENAEILDAALKNAVRYETGTFVPINTSQTKELTLEFAGKPMMLMIISSYGILFALRDCPYVYNAKNDTGISDDVNVSWGENSVTFTTSACMTLVNSSADPYYIALTA